MGAVASLVKLVCLLIKTISALDIVAGDMPQSLRMAWLRSGLKNQEEKIITKKILMEKLRLRMFLPISNHYKFLVSFKNKWCRYLGSGDWVKPIPILFL